METSKDWIAYAKNVENTRYASGAMGEGCDRLFKLHETLGVSIRKADCGYRCPRRHHRHDTELLKEDEMKDTRL